MKSPAVYGPRSLWRVGIILTLAVAGYLLTGLFTNDFGPHNRVIGQTTATCPVTYTVHSQWGDAFLAEVVITNNGAPINGWTLTWTFPGNQVVTQLWNGKVSQSGANVTVVNETYNNIIQTGGKVSFGFIASYSGANPLPTA